MGKQDDDVPEDFGETRNGPRSFCASVTASSASSALISLPGLGGCRLNSIEGSLNWLAGDKISKGRGDGVAMRYETGRRALARDRLELGRFVYPSWLGGFSNIDNRGHLEDT
jgi:hypothetical protein